MSPSFSGAALALVLALAWLLGRPRPSLMRSQDATAVAALNRAQISRIVSAPAPGSASVAMDPLFTLPPTGGERQQRLRQWRSSLRGPTALRRRFVQASAASGDRAVLPLLRQALNDPDPLVARVAAAGLESFRRHPAAPAASAVQAQAPRNVARMR